MPRQERRRQPDHCNNSNELIEGLPRQLLSSEMRLKPAERRKISEKYANSCLKAPEKYAIA
jgi:hypothetical protein